MNISAIAIRISDFLLLLACVYICFGLVGIFRFKSIYSRLLCSSKIDTAAMLTLLIGLIVRCGIGAFSMKLFLLLATVLLTTPISSHVIARSAFETGIELEVVEPDSIEKDAEGGCEKEDGADA